MLPRNHRDRIRIAFDDRRLVANAGLLLPATLARQRRESTDQSPGYGEAGIADVLPRAAGDDAARASHPGPHDSPRPPSASGGQVRDRAQAAS